MSFVEWLQLQLWDVFYSSLTTLLAGLLEWLSESV